MSKREYEMMRVIKNHKIETAAGLDALLGMAIDMLSENGDLPTDRIKAFGNARGLSTGKAFTLLVNRGIDAFDADKPSE